MMGDMIYSEIEIAVEDDGSNVREIILAEKNGFALI